MHPILQCIHTNGVRMCDIKETMSPGVPICKAPNFTASVKMAFIHGWLMFPH